MIIVETPSSDHHVGLLYRPRDHLTVYGVWSKFNSLIARCSPVNHSEILIYQLHHFIMIGMSCNRDKNVIRLITLPDIVEQILAGKGCHCLFKADNGPAQRVIAEHTPAERFKQGILRAVTVHLHLFEYHPLLRLHLLLRKCGVLQHIRQKIEGPFELAVERSCIVAGILIGGKGVHIAANRLHTQSYIVGRTRFGSVEEHVLQKVGDTGLLIRFITTSRLHPDPYSYTFNTVNRLSHNPEPVIQLRDRKSTRLNSSHVATSYAVFCLKDKNVLKK